MKRNVFGALMTLIVASTIAIPAVHAQMSMTRQRSIRFQRWR